MPPSQTVDVVAPVGRDPELTTIDQILVSLPTGGGALLDIIGEPGIGKTTLLAQLGARATAAGAVVLRGSAHEFEQDVPFALIVDALGPAVSAMDPVDLNRLGSERRSELAAVFPAVAVPGTAEQAPMPNERYRLHRATRALIESLAGDRPLVLILDDLHWADPASAELVASLVRSRPAGPVLLAIGRRVTALLPSLGVALDLAQVGERAWRLTPGPLSLDDAAPMLPTGLSVQRRRQLHSRSGGNPFYLEQLSKTSARPAQASAAPDDDVPASIAAVLHEEMLPLSDDAVAMLRAAAVVGDPFEISLTAAVATVDGPAGLVALDELVAADLVRQQATPRTFSIRHPLLRSAVYSSAPVGWRLAAHARAAAELARASAPAVAQAHHVEHCASVGDEAAADLLVAAATEIASRAPATAAEWLLSAVRISPASGDGASRRRALLPQLAGALVAAGQLDEALGVAKEVVGGLAPGDPGFVPSVAGCAAIERMLGRFDDARARLSDALDGLPPGDTASSVALRLELAADASLAADFHLMRKTAGETLVAAEAVSDEPAIACATSALAFAEYSVGRFDEAAVVGQRALELVDALSDASLATRLETILHLGWAAWFMGRFDTARALFDRGLRVARANGGGLVIELSVGSIVTLAGSGRLDEAIDLADGASEEARLMGNGHTLVWALFAQCMALEPVADPSVIVRAGEEALAVSRPFEGSTIAAACGWAFASGLVAAGDGRRAVTVMLELQGGPDLPWFFPAHRATCYEVLTRAELLSGRTTEAAAWAARARAVSDRASLPFAAAMADRAEAHVALANGDALQALTLARRSVEATQALGALVEAARGRLLVGQALALAGERDFAAAELREAEGALLRSGARRLQGEAVRELRRIGRRPTREGRGGEADPRGSGALSAREREIAELAAAGNTNKAIAATLYLSEKTVETHLAGAFVKLGVKRRGALVEALADA